MAETGNAALVEATRLLAEVDPLGLVRDGSCPEDEYEAEAEALLESRRPVTPEATLKAFRRWWGAEISLQKATRIAAGIRDIQRRV